MIDYANILLKRFTSIMPICKILEYTCRLFVLFNGNYRLSTLFVDKTAFLKLS